MNYWIFKCNPEKYDIDRRMTDPDSRTCWRVTRYRDEVKAGDIAFIWKSGPQRGIVAAITIDTNPKEMEEPEHERKYALDLDTGIMPRVVGTFIRRNLNLSHLYLRGFDYSPHRSDLPL